MSARCATGYSANERTELEATINGSAADVVLAGTPSDLAHILRLDKPVVRARYEFAVVGDPSLRTLIEDVLRRGAVLTATTA
jgi:predicted GTPase